MERYESYGVNSLCFQSLLILAGLIIIFAFCALLLIFLVFTHNWPFSPDDDTVKVSPHYCNIEGFDDD
jgi:hypothetical protein